MCRTAVDGTDAASETETGATNLVVSPEMVVVSMDGEVGRREEVVEAVLGKAAGVAVMVVDVSTVFVVPVTVLVTVVLPVATESETPVDAVEVVAGVTEDGRVDISLVSLAGDLLVGAGSSLVPALGDLSWVVVKSESVGWVEEVNQNRAVMAKGAPLVLGVVGLTLLVVLVPLVGGASVTLTVGRRSG